MSVTTNQPASAPIVREGLSPTDIGLLVLRIALAAVFIAHGGQKMFGWFGGKGLEATIAGMGQMGIPAALAFLAAFTEFFGGLAVLVGLLARLASLGLFITMMVAVFGAHLKGGFFLPAGYEYAFTLGMIALALIFTGPGRIAIADIEGRLFRRRVK